MWLDISLLLTPLLSGRKTERLTDEDVNAAMKKILNGLQGLGIELRA